MAIEISQIHNLVRTYQRALQDRDDSTETPHDQAPAQDDKVSVSDEARSRCGHSAAHNKKAHTT